MNQPPRGRQNPGICTFDDRYIVITSGFDPDDREFFKHGDCYDTLTESFKSEDFIPRMSATRFSHGLFQFGPEMIYAVCGNTDRAGHLKNIERLNFSKLL